MKRSKIVGFNPELLIKTMTEKAVAEQNRRLVEYAKEKILQIGNMIRTYNSRHHMDRTGNLLDSLCWGLSYRGKLIESGFYREQRATELSYLHEWFYDNAEPVGGHVLASNFIKQMANLGYSGWRLFFAVLAPYWGYWEEGFSFKGTKFLRFAVMTEFHDVIKGELSPAKVSFRTKAPEYSAESWDRLKKRRDSRAGKGGSSVYDKYPRGKGSGKYNY